MTREFIEGTTVSPKFDLRVGGTKHEVDTILRLISHYGILNFVEVGIHEGGLTEYLLFETSCNYLGVEINEGIVSNNIKSLPNFRAIFSDCMTEETVKNVESFLFVNFGSAMIYCDNGNKKEEIKIYNKIAKSGDILLTHDFSDGVRKVWGIENYNYPEVIPEDIQFLEDDITFERLPEGLLKETRLVGWRKK